MKTLKQGDRGQDVTILQKMLQENGFSIVADGDFGKKTHLAVCQFQQSANLVADGIVGTKTWAALAEKQEIDFEEAATILGVELAAIRAVHEVESAGRKGFLSDGRPIILFEGHVFWNQLKKLDINPEEHVEGNEDILFSKWDKAFYKGGAAEYDRLQRAIDIHNEAALCSASWGMFQIMGFNYQLCGYNTVSEYVADMKKSEHKQLLAFIKFLQNSKIDNYLKELDWAGFALKYNGSGYKQNRYDEKLEEAYQKFKN